MATLGLVGARAGSKRIEGKNMADLGGRPLIAYTLERAVTLLERGVLDDCIVSSDDEAVLDCAYGSNTGAGLGYLRRSPELAADDTPDRAWVASLMDREAWVKGRKADYDTIVLMRPTSPFLEVSTVQAMVERFRGSEATALITAAKVGSVAKCWASVRGWTGADCPPDSLGFLDAWYPDAGHHEEPSVPPWVYLQTGGCDVIRASNLPASLRGDRVDLHEVSWPESCDINEPVDLEMARAWMYRNRVKEVLREV